MTNPVNPVYIVSKGRSDSMITSKSLSRMKVPHYIVIEPQDEELYENALDNFKIRKIKKITHTIFILYYNNISYNHHIPNTTYFLFHKTKIQTVKKDPTNQFAPKNDHLFLHNTYPSF